MLNLSSRDGVAKTLSAALRCRCVRFKVFVSLLLDQLVSVSPRLEGPYNGGAGFQVLSSSAKRYVCSFVLHLVGGFGFNIGVDLVLPGFLLLRMMEIKLYFVVAVGSLLVQRVVRL